MAKLPCIPQSRIFTLKETGETMSYDQVRQYLMSNPDLWLGKGEAKEIKKEEKSTEFGKALSASSRFKPKELVVFDTPIVGPNGNKLVAYQWAYEWTMKENKEGELVDKRISDWTQAESSAETGRDVVHKFTVQKTDGSTVTVSSETIPSLLGYVDAKQMKGLPSVVSAVKTLAKQRMQLAIMEAQEAEYKALEEKFEKADKPEVKEVADPAAERFGINKEGEFTTYGMGDVSVRQDNRYNWDTKKFDKVPLSKETVKELERRWILKRIEEAGGKYPSNITDLRNRVKRQERRVEEATNSKITIKEQEGEKAEGKPLKKGQLLLKDGRVVTPTDIDGQTTFYHGSTKPRKGRLRANWAEGFGEAVYFGTDKKAIEEDYEGQYTTTAQLNLKKPLYYNNKKDWDAVVEKAVELYSRKETPKLLDEYSKVVNGAREWYDEDAQAEYEAKGYIEPRSAESWVKEEDASWINKAAQELGYDAIIAPHHSFGNEIAVLDENAIIYPEEIETEGKEATMPKAPYVQEVIPPINEEQAAGEKEVEALKKGDKITTTHPMRLLKGIYGKRNVDGSIRSAHTGVNGIFSSITEKIARRYEGEEGVVVFEIPAGVTVETVKVVQSPESKGVAVSAVRQMETDAINASDAQVVKLITMDSRGEESQYIIKDPALRKIGYKPSERKALSPEQELKQAFDKWKSETGKLGIVPNWERQAKADIEFFKAVRNYIISKVQQGVYTFEQFVKDLGRTKVENVEEDRDKWEGLYNRAVQEAKPLERKAVKAAVEKTAGIKRSTKGEVQRIIDRAFAIGMGMGTKEGFVKGATAGMKAGAVEGRTQAVDMLRNALANLSGELTPKQVSAIVERMGKLKTFSEAAKQSFIDYADKVIEDANYAAKEKKATEIKKAVKQMSKRDNVAANDQSLYKSFASLSISHLTPSDLDVYMEWGVKIKNRALKPGDRAQLASFIEQAQEKQNAIVQERSEKMKEGRLRNLRAEFDEMEAAGTLPRGIATFDEYVTSKKPKPKGETLEDKISAIEEGLDEIPEGENEMIDKLRNLDLSVLNKEDLTLIDNSLYNYIDTGKLYGIGDPLTKAEYLGRVKAAVEAGVETRRQVDRKDVERLGMGNLFTTLGETKDVAAKLRGLLIQPWLSAATKANSRYIEIEAALMAKADKLKIKQPNWNRIDLFGFLNEGEDNPELFEKLKEQKLSDLETLKERLEINRKKKDNSGTAKAQEYAYDALKAAVEGLDLNENTTLDSVRDRLSENEIAFYNETRKYLDQYSPKALENMELYGNKEVGITKNYWPRTTNKINERPTGIDAFDLYGSEYVGKNMFGREKGRSRLLGKAGYYTPIGQENYFNGLKETMLIAEAAHEYHGMQALYNTPEKGFSQLIKGQGAGDLKQLMIDWIMDTKNVGRYQGGVAKVGEDILNAIQKGFTRALINNPTQVLKQPTALAYTFAEAPKPFFKSIGLIGQAMVQGKNSPLSKAINGLFETTTLGQRLYHPEIIEVKEKYTIDKPQALRFIQQLLKGFNASIGGNLLVPVDSIVSQVATLAGYIQQAEKSGKKFDIFDEQAKGYDMEAAAAADQMQAKTNNENAAIYFSKRQLNNRALYYLGNFQANAVRNLYISIRKIVSGRTKQEVQEGIQGVAGYILSATLFVGAGMLSSYLTTATAFTLYQSIMNLLGDTEDDEEEKKRILAYLDSKQLLNAKRKVAGEAVSVATGIYGTMARAALEATLAGLEKAYYKKTEEQEKPSDRIFFTPEAAGYAGVVADNIISPLEQTAKATDPQEEAMAQTGLLAAKILGQSAIGFYAQNLLNARKLSEKEAKTRKEEETKTLEQRAFPRKKKLAEAKKQWTKSIESKDAGKAKAAFEEVVKLSDDSPYITAINLRESFYKDNVKPSIISSDDEYIWLQYIFEGKHGDAMIGDEMLQDLVPPSDREKYMKEYEREMKKVQDMTSVMNKIIKVEDSNGKSVDWSAPYDWVKYVQQQVGGK